MAHGSWLFCLRHHLHTSSVHLAHKSELTVTYNVHSLLIPLDRLQSPKQAFTKELLNLTEQCSVFW